MLERKGLLHTMHIKNASRAHTTSSRVVYMATYSGIQE